jgi:hypothetical protein
LIKTPSISKRMAEQAKVVLLSCIVTKFVVCTLDCQTGFTLWLLRRGIVIVTFKGAYFV